MVLRYFLIFCFAFGISKTSQRNDHFVFTKREHSIFLSAISLMHLTKGMQKQKFSMSEINKIRVHLYNTIGGKWYDQHAKVIIEYTVYKGKKYIINFKFNGCGKEIFLQGMGLAATKMQIRPASKPFIVMRGVVHGNFEKFITQKQDMPIILKRKILNFLKATKLEYSFGDKFYCLYDHKNFEVIALRFFNKRHSSGGIIYKKRLFLQDGKEILSKRIHFSTPVRGRISGKFGVRLHPILKIYRFHQGLDIAAPKGTPVKCAYHGSVVFAGRKGAYGNCVEIKHTNNISTFYAHLSKIAKNLHRGKFINERDVIAYVGTSGLSTGPHLHYEVRIKGKRVNPMNYSYQPHAQLTGSEYTMFKSYARRLFNYD